MIKIKIQSSKFFELQKIKYSNNLIKRSSERKVFANQFVHQGTVKYFVKDITELCTIFQNGIKKI